MHNVFWYNIKEMCKPRDSQIRQLKNYSLVSIGWQIAGSVIALVSLILLPISLYFPLFLNDYRFIIITLYFLSVLFLIFMWRISHQILLVNWAKQQSATSQTTIQTQAAIIEKNEIILSSFMDASVDCIILVNVDKKIVRYNSSAKQVFSPKIGQSLHEMYQKNNTNLIMHLDISQDHEISVVLNGILCIFIVVVTEIHVYDEVITELSYHDVTEQRNVQNHLIHLEKINTINTFLCGTVHDVKNLFSTILLFTEWLKYKSSSSNCMVCKTTQEKASQLGKEVYRTKLSLTRLISTDYECDERWELQDINLIISEAVNLFTSTRSTIISLNLSKEPCLVYCNKNLISNVMVNLIINAKDAMQDVGTITIITDIYDNCCRIFVKDTGGGIPINILPYLFDPFFTTKHHQGGTGLGLHIVKNIIQQHRGIINVLSNPGDTVFIISLPLSE